MLTVRERPANHPHCKGVELDVTKTVVQSGCLIDGTFDEGARHHLVTSSDVLQNDRLLVCSGVLGQCVRWTAAAWILTGAIVDIFLCAYRLLDRGHISRACTQEQEQRNDCPHG